MWSSMLGIRPGGPGENADRLSESEKRRRKRIKCRRPRVRKGRWKETGVMQGCRKGRERRERWRETGEEEKQKTLSFVTATARKGTPQETEASLRPVDSINPRT